MFTITDIIYYLLFCTAMILSFKATEQNLRGLIFLRALLICGLINELTVEFLDYYTVYGYATYHFYVPLEYVLLSCFFIKFISNKRIRQIIALSLIVYFTIDIYYSTHYYSLKNYPAIPYNIGCFFSVIWAVFVLFTLEVRRSIKVTSLPIFWICAGLIIFYLGVFFYNAVYNHLIHEKTALAKSLRLIINLNLNYLFYIIWSYAFICSIRLKKYSTQ